MAVRGAAGTGKTAMMKASIAAMNAAGHKVEVFAPTAEASRGVLREAGFERAETVARLFQDLAMQRSVAGKVLWIDESGLLSARQMQRLLGIAEAGRCRVILSGDPAQHGPVERGDALSILEQYAGLKTASLETIRRQQLPVYRDAVQSLSRGDAETAFHQLDQLGWIHESPRASAVPEQLASEFATCVRRGERVLAICPTHADGEAVNAAIRQSLRATGELTGLDEKIHRLEPLSLTEAQKSDLASYAAGQVLTFHRTLAGIRAKTRVKVLSVQNDHLLVQCPDERTLALAPADSAAWSVFRETTMPIAAGDQIRITAGGTTLDGKHRFNNGALYRVAAIDAASIRLDNGWLISRNFGHLNLGYCLTSHAAQGKTVDRVLIAQPASSLAAASAEQFYVSVSRGRLGATIYTDDKPALLSAVSRTSARPSAHDLVRGTNLSRTRRHLQLIESARFHECLRNLHGPDVQQEIARQPKESIRLKISI